ncbi:MAG: hypothetical protein HY337_06125 [Gemmatimonadetes bacterium]|nr:hypothetical protein [Gemmatimonadota bacterium]
MTDSIEYNGFVITPAPKQRREPPGWTLEVHITPAGRVLGKRRCRTGNTYDTEEEAIAHCFELGRRIVDNKVHPRSKGEA